MIRSIEIDINVDVDVDVDFNDLLFSQGIVK
jgi:hypothetical protein